MSRWMRGEWVDEWVDVEGKGEVWDEWELWLGEGVWLVGVKCILVFWGI